MYLKDLQAHVCDSQVDLGALSVSGGMKANPIHLQFTSNLQNLEIWFCWGLPTTGEEAKTKIRENI